MLKGELDNFAIESKIVEILTLDEHMAIGFFNIFIDGQRFGISRPDATHLGNAYDVVCDRIRRRGHHHIPELSKIDGYEIIRSFLQSEYAGLPDDSFSSLIYEAGICWAPLGQEGFDDGSNILQFDEGSRVRLLGCKNSISCEPEPGTSKEKWIESVLFYSILEEWRSHFLMEWQGGSS